MKKLCFTSALSALFLTSCIVTSCHFFSSEQKASLQFNRLVHEYFESCLKLHPLFASSIGDHRFDDQLLIPIKQEYRDQEKALLENTLTHLQKIPYLKLPPQERTTYQILLEDLQSELALHQVDFRYLMPFDQFSSFFADFAELASGESFVTFETELDYENFLKRMSVVPAYIDAMIENMQEGMQKKLTTPRILVEQGLKQLQALLPADPKKSLFYKPLLTLEEKVDIKHASSLKERYSSMIIDVLYPSYQKLESFVQQDYLPQARVTDGLCELPGGKELYLALIRQYTTTHLTPDEIIELGTQEVERIQKEFEQVKEEMHFQGDIKAFFESLQANPALYPFRSAEEILSTYHSIYKQVLEKVPLHFNLMPHASLEIKEVEPFKAANASESYQIPSQNGTRPAIFWVPIPNPTKYSAKEMEALFLHEGIPGHHFQLAIQQELPNLPPYRRFTHNTAYAEGWALYAESLGKELGLYTDPYQWLGRLTLEMHRAIRLVVDTGIHWKGWTHDKAIQYSLDHEPRDPKAVAVDIERYMAIPAQALSYKVGELAIQHLKKLAQAELGPLYSEKEFHDQVLEDGALPLSVLDMKILRWIELMQKGEDLP